MELRHLRYFVTVAELGSVSRAAEKLFMAQPPLSAQVRQLEEELGVALFVRLPRGVRLTPAGEVFLEDARAILVRAQHAAVRARERLADHGATVRFGLVQSTTQSVLPGLLARVATAGLDVTIEAREMITSRALRALHDGEIDLALARPERDMAPRDMVVAQIEDPYCLAVFAAGALGGSRAPLALESAASERFIAFSRFQDRDYFDATLALCVAAGFSPDFRSEASGFNSVLAMVAAGLGVAIVPASCAVQAVAGVTLRRIHPSPYTSRLVLLAPTHRPERMAASVIALAVRELEDLRARLAGTVPRKAAVGRPRRAGRSRR